MALCISMLWSGITISFICTCAHSPLVFPFRPPAPMPKVSWMGWPTSTGHPAWDYYALDSVLAGHFKDNRTKVRCGVTAFARECGFGLHGVTCL